MEKKNKTSNLTRGRWGEDKAADYLSSKGLTIIDRNYSTKIGELDIVASDGTCLIFAEVKTRTRTDKGLPAQFVSKAKMRRIALTAEIFRKAHPELYKYQPRFDIVEVLGLDSGVYIRHIENAFSW
ncbi:MAG: YraN family protein [Firmicutes bacterium]|nr:YraN family protein [Bacillota bacterium]